LFERAEFTNLSDRIRLFNFATVLGELTEEESEQLLIEIFEGLNQNSMKFLNLFDLFALLWNVTYQRYILIAREFETGLRAPMRSLSETETSMVQLLFPYLEKSSVLKRSRTWAR
jgi:hypothetical protein